MARHGAFRVERRSIRAARKLPTLEEWRPPFRKRVSTLFADSMRALLRPGCTQSDIEALIFAASGVGGNPTKEWKEMARRGRREAGRLTLEAEDLAHRVSLVNEFVMPSPLRENDRSTIRLNGKTVEVPLECFEYLPEILRSYSQFLKQFPIGADLRRVDDRGPELMILAAYVKGATRIKSPNRFLANLLYEASTCVGRSGPFVECQSPSEALRKILARYRRDHPRVCRRIQALLATFLAATAGDRGRSHSLLNHMRRGLADPSLLVQRKEPERALSQRRTTQGLGTKG